MSDASTTQKKRKLSGMASAAASAAVITNKTWSNEEHKKAVLAHFAAMKFADMSNILEQLRNTMLKHPMHPAYAVSSRAPTKEEISRAPLEHIYTRKKGAEKSLLENPELFQMGVPFNVEYSPFPHGCRDSKSTYSGEVKFSLFGLPGSLKQEYTARIPKMGDQGFDRLSLGVQFTGAACTTTVVNFKDVSYWDDGGSAPFLKFHPPDEPVLNMKFKDVGLSDKQSMAVLTGLFDKFRDAFDGSGLENNPCGEYFRIALEHELVKDWGTI